MRQAFLPLQVPAALEGLLELALDLRWTWSHAGDALWETVDPTVWEHTRNPWTLLQNVSQERLQHLTQDAQFMQEFQRLMAERARYLTAPGWYGDVHSAAQVARIAYFSMEFGLGNGLPLYAGGLGVLAGDYLKAASDLGLPVVGVGLLYQRGYFRQMLDGDGRQMEMSPYNDPTGLPIQPVHSPSDGWLHVSLDFPGRTLLLRIWQARVGRVSLYLLDSNDPKQ